MVAFPAIRAVCAGNACSRLRSKSLIPAYRTASPSLNGYQKSRCFYCFRDISLDNNHSDFADVDHFFPHDLRKCAAEKPINGVANLVLACTDCNRGVNGKSSKLPALPLLERLHERNEYLIISHHPLRETLMVQTYLL